MSSNAVNSIPLFPGRRRGKEPIGVDYHAKAQTDEDAARRAEAVQKTDEAKLLNANVALASQLCKQCFGGNCFICGAYRRRGMHGHMYQHIVRGDYEKWLHSEQYKTGSTTTT